MQYFFNDHLRWSLGWETPNQAGAFIATLVPWLWGLTLFALGRTATSQGGKRWVWRLLAVFFAVAECGAIWALVKTYSRGALVGALAALGLIVVLVSLRLLRIKRRIVVHPCVGGKCADRLFSGKAFGVSLAPWLVRFVLILILLMVSDFGQRLAPDYAAADRSVTNRVDLWKGGLELIAISPLQGWGWGNSGASFMHWTQPIGRSEAYKSMVNSYLTVGVEGGLPVLAVVLGGCLLVFYIGIRGTMMCGEGGNNIAHSQLLLAATASWLAWLVCLFFSNLWIIPLLWILPGLTLVIGWLIFSLKGLGVKIPARGLVLCIFGVCAVFWLAGYELYKRSPVAISRAIDGSVALVLRKEIIDTRSLIVLPDVQALGESYGQELRRWVLAANQSPVKLRVIASDMQALPEGETVVAFGAACSDSRLNGRVVWRIHPTQAPDSEYKTGPGSFVQLAGIDVAQKNVEWTAWAEEKGGTVGQSWGLAVDIRARWPELILDLQSSCKDR